MPERPSAPVGPGPATRPETGQRMTKTLVLEVALPDFNAEDYDLDDEIMGPVLREFCETDEPTPEQLGELVLDESGLCSPRVKLSILLGDKGGTGIEHVTGQIVGARLIPRIGEHEATEDERVEAYEAEWIEREADRLRRESA